jgi:hypothetical protein
VGSYAAAQTLQAALEEAEQIGQKEIEVSSSRQ